MGDSSAESSEESSSEAEPDAPSRRSREAVNESVAEGVAVGRPSSNEGTATLEQQTGGLGAELAPSSFEGAAARPTRRLSVMRFLRGEQGSLRLSAAAADDDPPVEVAGAASDDAASRSVTTVAHQKRWRTSVAHFTSNIPFPSVFSGAQRAARRGTIERVTVNKDATCDSIDPLRGSRATVRLRSTSIINGSRRRSSIRKGHMVAFGGAHDGEASGLPRAIVEEDEKNTSIQPAAQHWWSAIGCHPYVLFVWLLAFLIIGTGNFLVLLFGATEFSACKEAIPHFYQTVAGACAISWAVFDPSIILIQLGLARLSAHLKEKHSKATSLVRVATVLAGCASVLAEL